MAQPRDAFSHLSLRPDRPGRALLFYALLTVLMTFPLALRWNSALPAGAGDLWQNYWNFWWWKHCLLEGLNPLHSPLLFHPAGADLVFHTHSPFNQVLAMPVNLLFGEAAAYNFCVLFALTVSGFGTYLLVRELTGDSRAGLLAGMVFAYFPQTIEQSLEHLNLVSVQFIPLSLYCLVRWGRSFRLADALALGAFLGLNALCSWHLGLKLGLIVVPWIAILLFRNRRRWQTWCAQVAAAAALATLLVLPLLVPMAALIASGSDYYIKAPVPRGIDAAYLLTPTYASPLFGSVVESRYLDRAYQASGFVCYLGIVPVFLAGIGLWRFKSRCLPWLAVLLGGLVLALGANPFWNGTLHESVGLPFATLREIPILENLRVANRFLILTGLGLAVLTGFGWRALRPRSSLALPAAAILLLADYSWLPFPVQPVEHSSLLRQVASRPGAVLNIPFHQRNRTVHNMVGQTTHGRPIAGGYLSSYPPEIQAHIDNEPALRSLAGAPKPDVAVDLRRLRELGFRTVIIHKDRLDSSRQKLLREVSPSQLLERKRVLRLGGVPDQTVVRIREQLDEALGGASLEDERLAIYFL